jgi:hypothetical protein
MELNSKARLLALKYETRVDLDSSDKDTSLLRRDTNY